MSDPSIPTDPVGGFKEERLTIREHMDPDKHWIGETLPAASIQDVQYSGTTTKVGESPFPARSDHSHDARARYSAVATASEVIVPAGGAAYINTLTSPWGTENWRASGGTSNQLMEYQQEGAYQYYVYYIVNRTSGFFPAATAIRISFAMSNASFELVALESNVPQGRGRLVDQLHCDYLYYGGAGAPDNNVQLKFTNFDTVNWSVGVPMWELWRKHSLTGATAT